MSKRKRLSSRWIGFVILISLIISGCGSLQYDITPPPAEQQEEQIAATSQPSQTPIADVSQPAVTLSPDEIGTDAIVVTVVDHTGGVLLEQGLEVELECYQDFDLVYQTASVLSSNSRVLFEDVPFQAGLVYFASISYGGAIYRSEIVELDPDSTYLELNIQIFETTHSDEALIIDRVHVIADSYSQDFIQIVEIFIMSNLGNATVVAENPGESTVFFPLPDGAQSIGFDDGTIGQRYILTEDGFGDTVSIPPGSGVYQVLVYYLLPIKRDKIDFSQGMDYPVQAVIAMTPAGEISIKKSSLQDMGTQAIPDGTVQVYSGTSIARNDSLDFQLSIDEVSSVNQTNSTNFLSENILIGAGVLGGLIFIAGVLLFFNQRRRNLVEGDSIGQEADREEILDSIIALEDLFREGEIPQEVYEKKRQELKEKLDDLNNKND